MTGARVGAPRAAEEAAAAPFEKVVARRGKERLRQEEMVVMLPHKKPRAAAAPCGARCARPANVVFSDF